MSARMSAPGRGRFALVLAPLISCAQPAAAQRTVTAIHPEGIDGRVLERRIEIRIAADGTMSRSERRVVEYLTDHSVETYGDPILVHDARSQRLRVETARTTAHGGATLDTPPFAINELTLPDMVAAPEMAGIRATVVSHVGIEPGARAELAYVVQDTEPPATGFAAGEVALRWTLPVERFELRIVVPADAVFEHACVGCATAPAVTREGESRVYVWTAQRLAPIDWFEVADQMGLPWDGLEGPRIAFSTAGNWQRAAGPLVDAAATAPAEAVARKARALAADAAGPEQAAEALQAFVAEGIATVPMPSGLPFRPPATPEAVLERSYGTPVEKALLLASMLSAAGVQSWPVLVAGGRGIAAAVPHLDQFREAWVAVGRDGEPSWWLPVDRRATFHASTFPGGRHVLHIREPVAPRHHPPAAAERHAADARVRIDVDSEGRARGEARIVLAGAHNPYHDLRKKGRDPATHVSKAAADLVPEGRAEGAVVEVFGPERTVGSARIEGRLRIEGDGMRTLPLPWPGRNPLPAVLHRSRRDTALDIETPFRRSIRYEIRLPSGWEAASVPRSVRIDSAAGSFIQEVVVAAGTVRVERSIEVRVRRIEPADYAGLRAIHQALSTAGAEAVVLRGSPRRP